MHPTIDPTPEEIVASILTFMKRPRAAKASEIIPLAKIIDFIATIVPLTDVGYYTQLVIDEGFIIPVETDPHTRLYGRKIPKPKVQGYILGREQ